jgi:cytochrome oxidase Cu insertion factor (SCO1/SenC/PrrC family)
MKILCSTSILLLMVTIHVAAQAPATTIPSFTFKKLNKTEFTNKDLKPGKLLFFIFFDTECDHCQRTIQYIDKNYLKFKKAAIYLITLDSSEKIKPFMNKYGINLKDKKEITILQDLKYEFMNKFKPRKYPSLFLYSVKKELILYEDNEQNLFRFIQLINAPSK